MMLTLNGALHLGSRLSLDAQHHSCSRKSDGVEEEPTLNAQSNPCMKPLMAPIGIVDNSPIFSTCTNCLDYLLSNTSESVQIILYLILDTTMQSNALHTIQHQIC